VAQGVAVQQHGLHSGLEQPALHPPRDGGLSRAGQAGEPEHHRAVPLRASRSSRGTFPPSHTTSGDTAAGWAAAAGKSASAVCTGPRIIPAATVTLV
jgi:hypothetical protein